MPRSKPPSQLRHGDARDGAVAPEYNSWAAMWKRCTRPATPGYQRYGGRGITVCPTWRQYETFLADMGRKPSTQHTLDRRDTNAGYTPENCRWATRHEQHRNKRSNRHLQFQGTSRTLAEWAEVAGLRYTTLRERLRHGWSVERALLAPVQVHQRREAR